MFEKIRGQLRHILSLLGAIIATKYIGAEGVEEFTLKWELFIAVVMIIGPMIDSWVTKKEKNEGR